MPAPRAVAQHVPGGVKRQDPLIIATGVRMVELDQGPIGGLDLGHRRQRRHPQNGVMINPSRLGSKAAALA